MISRVWLVVGKAAPRRARVRIQVRISMQDMQNGSWLNMGKAEDVPLKDVFCMVLSLLCILLIRRHACYCLR